MSDRINVFKLTSDDWAPSYKLAGYYRGREGTQLVNVLFMELSDGCFRVCVWGADDFGLEKDFHDKEEAKRIFEKIISLDIITIQWLREFGLNNA